jgi:hypothetical protein
LVNAATNGDAATVFAPDHHARADEQAGANHAANSDHP